MIKLQHWLLAIRPKTLPAALAPVFVGLALAYREGEFVFLPACAALMGALLLQIGSNLANDYFDFIKGADTPERLGPQRAAASGLISLRGLQVGMGIVFGAALLIGFYLLTVGGWPIAAIGIASIIAAITYTGGPFPFGYHGLGELFVFIFFGLVAVCGTYYVQTLTLSSLVILAAIPVGLLITAILVVNNLRDIETDEQAGKRTLAVMIGRQATRIEYLLLVLVAYLIALLLAWHSGSYWLLLPWLTAPLAMLLIRTIFQANDGPTFNNALASTARLSLFYSLLLAVGLLL